MGGGGVSVTFRPGRTDEVTALAGLMIHSFPNPERDLAWWESFLVDGPHGGVETLWVGEEDGRPVAVCQLYRKKQWIARRQVPVMGLGAVAIAPTRRRRGLAGQLIRAGFAQSLERGDVATALYPFRVAFYSGLGYGLAGTAHQYHVPPDQFPDDREGRDRLRLVATPGDEAAMRDVYEAGARRDTGQFVRDERSWCNAWPGTPDYAGILYMGDDGKAEGYAIVRYRADLPLTERYLEVEERMWLTPRAQRGIYAYLSSVSDQWREVLYRAHPDELFVEQLSEPRLPQLAEPGWRLWFPSAVVLRGPMFRLLSVPRALEMRSTIKGTDFTLELEVADEQIPENRGPWRLRVEDGRIHVERGTGGACDARISTDVETLSRIYVGAISPGQAVGAERATIDRREALPALNTALRVPRPWTFDRF
jgi:predicted acetyltransferase